MSWEPTFFFFFFFYKQYVVNKTHAQIEEVIETRLILYQAWYHSDRLQLNLSGASISLKRAVKKKPSAWWRENCTKDLTLQKGMLWNMEILITSHEVIQHMYPKTVWLLLAIISRTVNDVIWSVRTSVINWMIWFSMGENRPWALLPSECSYLLKN